MKRALSGEREGNPRMKRAPSGEREGNPRKQRAPSGEREGNPRMKKENCHMRAPLPVTAAAAAASNVGAVRVDDVFYPSSDGRPMSDNMWQGKAIVNADGDLESAHPKALVAADILVYPEKGNNRNRIAPDVLVGLGLGRRKRSSYFVWEEGKPPDWVLEVASPGTEAEDRGAKRRKYAEMGVPEYWMFDAKGDVYPPGTPRLQGLKLVDGEYRPLKSRLVDGKRMIRSEVLGLDVRVEDELLRFRDVATGKDIRRRGEIEADEEHAHAATARAQAATARYQAQTRREAAQRKAAEARAQQEATLRKAAEVRAQRQSARAEQEAAQRKAAEARAEQESAIRSAAEARIAQLEAALRSRAAPPRE